jgi:hypothetical protein
MKRILLVLMLSLISFTAFSQWLHDTNYPNRIKPYRTTDSLWCPIVGGGGGLSVGDSTVYLPFWWNGKFFLKSSAKQGASLSDTNKLALKSDTAYQIRYATTIPAINSGSDTLAKLSDVRSAGSGGGSFVPSPDEYVCGIQYRALNTKPYFADTAINRCIHQAALDGKTHVRLTSSIPDLPVIGGFGHTVHIYDNMDIIGIGDTIYDDLDDIKTLSNGQSQASIVNIYVDAIKPLVGTGNGAVHPYATGSNWNIDCQTIDATAAYDWAIFQEGGSTLTVRCNSIITTYAPAFFVNDGYSYIYCHVMKGGGGSVNAVAVCRSSGGNTYIHADSVVTAQNNAPEVFEISGTTYLTIGTAVHLGGGNVFTFYGNRDAYIYGGKFLTLDATTPSSVLYLYTSALAKISLVNTVFLNQNLSGYSVDAQSAQNIYILGSACATNAVSSNITQKVGTITVSTDIPNP